MSTQDRTETRSRAARAGRASATLAAAWGRLVDEWHYFRMWKAKGDVGSKWWVPRVGDRVRFHGKGHWLVYGVRVRTGEVELGRPGWVAVECCEPIPRGELEEIYGQWAARREGAPIPVLQPVEQLPPPPASPPSAKPVDLSGDDVFIVDGTTEGVRDAEEG